MRVQVRLHQAGEGRCIVMLCPVQVMRDNCALVGAFAGPGRSQAGSVAFWAWASTPSLGAPKILILMLRICDLRTWTYACSADAFPVVQCGRLRVALRATS